MRQPPISAQTQRLAERRELWLLVIDNADDPWVLAGAGTCVAEGRGRLRRVTGQAGMVFGAARQDDLVCVPRLVIAHRLPYRSGSWQAIGGGYDLA